MIRSNKKSPLRIAIDASDIGADMYKGGIYHYVINLCSNLRDLDSDNEYVVFLNYFAKRHAAVCQAVSRILAGRKMKVKLSRLPRTLMRKLQPPMNLFIGNVDILHGPFDHVPPAIGCKKIVTIHDLRSYDFEEILGQSLQEIEGFRQFSESFRGWIEWMGSMQKRVEQAVNSADRIITVSNFSKKALLKHTGSAAARVEVVYNGISADYTRLSGKEKIFAATREFGLSNNYILFVGHLDPLKNILRLIGAYRLLLDLLRPTDAPHLVFVTPTPQTNWFCEIATAKTKELSLSKQIHFIHNVANSALPALYNGAAMLVLPSLYEGFGLPVIEAMACGTPVVTSSAGSLPEIAGDAALFIDAHSTDSIAGGMYKLLSDDGLRRGLVKKGLARAKLFTWQNTAKKTLNIYKKSLEH